MSQVSFNSESEMRSFLRDFDSNGRNEWNSIDSSIRSEYLNCCYVLGMPRKLQAGIKKEITDLIGVQNVLRILDLACKDENDKIITNICKLTVENPDLEMQTSAVILKHSIRKRFRGQTSEEVSREVSQLLNESKFFDFPISKEVMEVLELRVRKMYRGGENDRVVSYLSNIVPSDRNFRVYKFLLLSLSAKGSDAELGRCFVEAIPLISEIENIEELMDVLYSNGKNQEIISIAERIERRLTFRGGLIYARSLKKMGFTAKSEESLEKIKKNAESIVLSKETGVATSLKIIKDIAFSGDIESAEKLLYSFSKRTSSAAQIRDDGAINDFVDLVADILNRQKIMRLEDALEISERLTTERKYSVSIRLLSPYIEHGITHSVKLFVLYARSVVGSKQLSLLHDLIEERVSSMSVESIEGLAQELLDLREFDLVFKLIEAADKRALNSHKIVRTFFISRTMFIGKMGPREFLMKLSTNQDIRQDVLLNFVERTVKLGHTEGINEILLTMKLDISTRLLVSMIIAISEREQEKAELLIEEMLNQTEEIFHERLSYQMIKRAALYSIDSGKFETAKRLVDFYEGNGALDKTLKKYRIRAFISLGEYEEAEVELDRNWEDFSEMERVRLKLQIGNEEFVNDYIDSLERNVIEDSEIRQVAEIYFRMNRFNEYIDLIRDDVLMGNFTITSLTQYFFALYKLGEEEKANRDYNFLWNRMRIDDEKRAILIIVGYDFELIENLGEEIELCLLMSSGKSRVPELLIESFLDLERIDLAYMVFRKSCIYAQTEGNMIELGWRIWNTIIDLNLKPEEIEKRCIHNEPVYTDVEVIRSIINIVKRPEFENRKWKKRGGKIAIQSHTLGIGGAERQASYLLSLLAKGKIKSEEFVFVTNLEPNVSQRKSTYYPKIDPLNLEIVEYGKPSETSFVVDSTILDKIKHLSPTKRRRIERLLEIYGEGDFDIAHLWQDWCNVYGGIAALASGVEKIILSARTLPPPKKGLLSKRSGRSYLECYQLLLGCEGVTLTHNSEYGSSEYAKWIGVSAEKFDVVNNGVSVNELALVPDEVGAETRESLGISEKSLIIGTIGRFTQEKRPWTFLKVAEQILAANGPTDFQLSPELNEWYGENEGMSSFSNDKWENLTTLLQDADKEIHFVILGDGMMFKRARKIVNNSNILSDKVHLVGFSNDVPAFLTEFDVFLLTSSVEGLPNVLIEAQLFGVPVLTTDSGGSKECVERGVTGVVCEKDDWGSISLDLAKIIADGKFRKNARKKSPAFAKKKFGERTWSKNMNKLYYGE